ncbi:hypothetical protein [Mycobacterium celatum]|uniref:hypothetical protein n=1 Tax=Mycobacterium celatum TaxID=28045 RepID=UPI000A6A3FF5|nr:hypothetical protein [Mycobacterium celatum]
MYGAVRGLEDGIDRLSEAGGWEGQAHDAAMGMFRRATHQTSDFATGVGAVGAAVSNGDSTIGAARYRLLRAADDIDQGELHVTDQWVVLIKPARMSAQHAAELQHQAEQEQAEINRLLLDVGDADDRTAANVQAAAQKLGFTLPGPNDMASIFPQSPSRPADEVPNPRTMQGLIQQGNIRGEDMAMTVRESSEKTTEDGQHVTTLMMQDGSKHVITNWGTLTPKVADDYYDKNGKFVSGTSSWTGLDNQTKYTQTQWADGTILTITDAPGSKPTASVTMADGRQAEIPADSPLFGHPVLSTIGGGLTGLETHAERGGRIPMLTPESVKDVGKAARYAGPALGIGAMAYDVATAATAHEACVAGVSGLFGTGGSVLGGAALAEGGPIMAGLGDVVGGAAFGWVGTKVGNVICPG